MEKGDPLMKIYLDHLEGHELTYNNTTITGMDLGIKQKLFKYYLARDSVYPVLAALALLFTIGLYLKSLFIAAMSLVAVILSLSTSLFFLQSCISLDIFSSPQSCISSCAFGKLSWIKLWLLLISGNCSWATILQLSLRREWTGFYRK